MVRPLNARRIKPIDGSTNRTGSEANALPIDLTAATAPDASPRTAASANLIGASTADMAASTVARKIRTGAVATFHAVAMARMANTSGEATSKMALSHPGTSCQRAIATYASPSPAAMAATGARMAVSPAPNTPALAAALRLPAEMPAIADVAAVPAIVIALDNEPNCTMRVASTGTIP